MRSNSRTRFEPMKPAAPVTRIVAFLKITFSSDNIYSFMEVGTKKLGVIDMTASVMCMENKMPLMIFGLNEKDSILNAMTGKFNGTVVTVD